MHIMHEIFLVKLGGHRLQRKRPWVFSCTCEKHSVNLAWGHINMAAAQLHSNQLHGRAEEQIVAKGLRESFPQNRMFFFSSLWRVTNARSPLDADIEFIDWCPARSKQTVPFIWATTHLRSASMYKSSEYNFHSIKSLWAIGGVRRKKYFEKSSPAFNENQKWKRWVQLQLSFSHGSFLVIFNLNCHFSVRRNCKRRNSLLYATGISLSSNAEA